MGDINVTPVLILTVVINVLKSLEKSVIFVALKAEFLINIFGFERHVLGILFQHGGHFLFTQSWGSFSCALDNSADNNRSTFADLEFASPLSNTNLEFDRSY